MTKGNVLMIEEPAGESIAYPTQNNTSSEKRLIHVARHNTQLSYTIYTAGLNEEVREWVQSIPNNAEDEICLSFWKKLNSILNEDIPIANPSEERWTNICSTLQGIGKSLFDDLVPPEVAECIKRWEPGSSVRFSTTEEWIPWELMHDGDNFLGDKFILVRYPRIRKGTRNRATSSSENTTTLQELKNISRIVNIVGGNIRPNEAAKKAVCLFDFLTSSIHIEPIKEQSLSKFNSVLSEADILHFTCHGHLKPIKFLQIFSDKSLSNNLCIDTVQTLTLKPGSFVFANACTSSTPSQAFSNFTSFGLEFYLQGADVFLGTLGIIPTEYAIIFAENVYKELFQANVKITIGQAVANAKRISRDSEKNFFWLLYCIYGNPDYCFEPIEYT